MEENKIENWEQIKEFPRYEISNLGRVRIIKTQKILFRKTTKK